MPYVVFLRSQEKDITYDDFKKLFEVKEKYTVSGNEAVYENCDTGVGFLFEYISEYDNDAQNVRSDGVYRIALIVEYCQTVFFFFEAMYQLREIVDEHRLVVYNPQFLGKEAVEPLYEEKFYDNWRELNEEAVREYMLGLREDMDNVPVFPAKVVRLMWEWNFNQKLYREQVADYMRIPTIFPVDFCGEEGTCIFWKDGEPIAIPEVDAVIISRSKKGAAKEEVENFIVSYEEIDPIVKKYSSGTVGNAFLLSYKEVPDDIREFISTVHEDNDNEYTIFDMCDILEYEVARDALHLTDD